MKSDERVVRIGGMLAIVCLCCAALAPAASAGIRIAYNTQDTPVLINTTNWSWINTSTNQTMFNNTAFFAAVANAHWNASNSTYPAYTWTQGDAPYYDRYYINQLMGTYYGNTHYFPVAYQQPPYQGDQWKWQIENGLSCNSTIYKKGLGGWIDSAAQPTEYYLWFGNMTKAKTDIPVPPPAKNKTYYCLNQQNASYYAELWVENG